MAKMVTKSILMPAALAAALDAEAREKKISLSELARSALSDRINLAAIEARLIARLDAQDEAIAKIIALVSSLEAVDETGSGVAA